MRKIETEILVIGGGATGTGVLRDLAMRGFKCLLVDKGDLTHGTTGRYHGLMHSGGRYVVKDPQAARECIQENRILRKIIPFCIEDTGGFFVVTPWDDPDYAAKFLSGCQSAEIPVEEIAIDQMLREEPLLNPSISRCFRVPDASADSFLAASANVQSAVENGAGVLTYHQVLHLIHQGNRVIGAKCYNREKDEEIEIFCDLVVNASGAWAGKIAETVGITISIIPGKGTMLAVNRRIVNTVVNRCKMPSDGDIIVPAHTVSVIGTTDVPVNDPDHFSIEPWEVNLMLDEGEKLVPGFREMRILRAWAGVRPLYKHDTAKENRDLTRAFVLLDHQYRDNIEGLITITSGKWTTYRKMAEVTVDLVCKKLNTQRTCQTATEILPDPSAQKSHQPVSFHSLGLRLAEIENEESYGELICECELVTRKDVENSILNSKAKTIDDIRRDVRLGMGPCQGGFCTYRVAGILHQIQKPQVETTNSALHNFLQERWKGLRPILWGQQLRQERLDELIYQNVLDIDHLPGSQASPLASDTYAEPESKNENPGEPGAPASAPAIANQKSKLNNIPVSLNLDVLVIGGGLSGLVTAWQAAKRGKRVRLVTKGWGINYWHSGCVDVFGYDPSQNMVPISSPASVIDSWTLEHPSHPYSRLGFKNISESITAFKDLCDSAGYPIHGKLEKYWILPTALGSKRPTCLAPQTMIAGELTKDDPILIVGFSGYSDFFPQLIADNLALQGIAAQSLILDISGLHRYRYVTSRILASMFDSPDFRRQFIRILKSAMNNIPTPNDTRVGLPAVLGLENAYRAFIEIQDSLGYPIFEIPTLPPSIPGMRLHAILTQEIERLGGKVFEGMLAISYHADLKRIQAVFTQASVRLKPHYAKTYVLASGGILGGGIQTSPEGEVNEVLFGLPIQAPTLQKNWLSHEFNQPHPIFSSGLTVNSKFQPVDQYNQPIYENLFVTGNMLSGGDYLHEHTLEGVSIASGYYVGSIL